MKKINCIVLFALFCYSVFAQAEKLVYHDIVTDSAGNILPWYSNETGKAWDHAINLVWSFWDTMRADINGIPYYMNHQVWKPGVNDARGIGGDQISMALSSWRLLYGYSGNERIKENMKFMSDYYLGHGFSPPNVAWPDIPFPYNTLIYSGSYDGDMIIGRNYTQPDKAGSFGLELLHLYKMTTGEHYPNITDDEYLAAAVKIANTLAKHTKEGDENNSPLPFKVNAYTGQTGILKNNSGEKQTTVYSSYTTNWAPALELFMELQQMKTGKTELYKQAADKIIRWMKRYPLKNNKWGPFFEDVPGWSDTQINAITFAQFMMNHPDLFPGWKTEVKKIFDWVYLKMANREWKKYAVIVINEQTAYLQPGNSHTARQAAAELQYMNMTGEELNYNNAIRQLNWATYMVDHDGKNYYPTNDVWLTDGYGDYVRHFLYAMAAAPETAPQDQEHILSTTSVIQEVCYAPLPEKYYGGDLENIDRDKVGVFYKTFDKSGIEKVRLSKKPSAVLFDRRPAAELNKLSGEGFTWKPFTNGGLLTIKRQNNKGVIIIK